MTETAAPPRAVDAVTAPSTAGADGPTTYGIDCPTAGVDGEHRRGIRSTHHVYPDVWSSRYTWVADLPAGGHSLVSLARASDGTQVVMRQANRPRNPKAHHIQDAELRTIDHPNIVRTLDGPLEDAGYRWQVLEYCARGSLTQVRTHGQPEPGEGDGYPPSPQALIHHVVAEVAEALHYLHETTQLIHTDIKPDNILMRADGSIALADLDLAVSVTTQQQQDEHTPARTTAYDPQDTTFTPAFDWAQLGYTALSLATGIRRPARYTWEWGLSAVDPRMAMLVKGLCARTPTDRWGYAQVRRWLAGEDVSVVEPEPLAGWGAASPTFVVHFAGQACTSPSALGDRMSFHWPETHREIQRERDGKPYIRWLGDVLTDIGHPVAQRVLDLAHVRISDPTQSLSPRTTVHPDHVAAMLITALNPTGPPRYAVGDGDAIDLTRETLGRTGRNAASLVHDGHVDAYEVRWVNHLYQSGILQAFSGMDGYAWLSQLEDDWPQVMAELKRLLHWASEGASQSRATYRELISAAGLPTDQTLEFQRGDWERFAAGEDSAPTAAFSLTARALALRALVDDTNAAANHQEAMESVARNGRSQPWFAHLAGWAPPPEAAGPTGYDPRRAVRPTPGLLARLWARWPYRWKRRSTQ